MFQRIKQALTPEHIRVARAEARAWQVLAQVEKERRQMARQQAGRR